MNRYTLLALLALSTLALPTFEQASPQPPALANLAARLKVPSGFIVEVIAAPPLVHHPMMGNFDERGRLFIAESSGLNLRAPELLKELPNKVLLLEDVDAKGRITKSRIFADKMTFPSGALPYNGSLYVTAAPHIWKMRDTKNVGVADERVELVSKFNFIGNAADIHGPFLGPDGRIYWCDGRHGHEIMKPDGTLSKGKAARIFRCKPDGSEVEVVCGGGMDNPVEIAFTDEGEPLVTVDILHNQPSRNDGIIFAIEGGNYPWHEASKELPRTGDLLPAIENLGWVAPSGIMRYRSNIFGQEYRNNLFTAQFNRHRIQRHILERDGAAFRCKTEDFLTTDDKNFHPTDVFEDADGSLIVIDTGGWFRIGCPTSKIAQPDIKGAIYRIRKKDAKPIDDPRGLAIAWSKLSPTDLVPLLDDPRFAVDDRAVEELASRGKEALPALVQAVGRKNTSRLRRNAVWAITRIDHPAARDIVRKCIDFNDKDISVLLAAIHSAGLHRDDRAVGNLCVMLFSGHPALRRQAATALSRYKNPTAVEAHDSLMVALHGAAKEGELDRFLEHAIIHAVIQIDDRKHTSAFLNDKSPVVRRAALIALDQMPNGNLTRAELAAQLNSDHKPLVKTALDIVASRPSWAGEITTLLREWLTAPADKVIPQDNLRGLLLALSKEPAIQDLMAQSLQNPKTPHGNRLLLVETMGLAPLTKLPPAWLSEIGKTLDQPDDALAQQGIAAIRARSLAQFDGQLDKIVHDVKRSADTRVQAFGIVAARATKVDETAFQFLLTRLHSDQPALARLAAAKGLSQAKLDDGQRMQLTTKLPSAGPLELPVLLAAFETNTATGVGNALLAALEKNPSLASVTPAALAKAVQECAEDVRKQAAKLGVRLQVDAVKQAARLDELQPLTTGGSLEQGRDIFFGNKASCSACHAVNNKGGGVGPDLGKIGAIRSARDLLESIVFPSASFARGFESYIVETKAGKSFTGILGREASDAIYLLTTERNEIRIPREEIEAFVPSRVSIMPQGLDAQLTRRELQDLLAYVQSLR